MYWSFLVLFIVAVLIPDIIRNPVYFLAEERAEEVTIFILGALAFFIFIRNEYYLNQQKREKEKEQKKARQAVKDLVDSYSYIGEVNRKMDILMNIALGLSDRSMLSKKNEAEIYESIVSAANFLMKADRSCLRFVNIQNQRTEKEIITDRGKVEIKNRILTEIGRNINIKKSKEYLVIASSQKVKDIRSFLIIGGYDLEEESNAKNLEILKVFASQAIFLYSFTHSPQEGTPTS